MKKSRVLIAAFIAVLSTSCSDAADSEQVDVTPETSEKIEQVQDANVELEEIDGTLDSLMNSIH